MKFMFRIIIVGLVVANLPTSAWSQMNSTAHVHVNGVHMTAQQIQQLEAWNCGNEVPSGDYWFDVGTGAWGYAGGSRQGFLGCYLSAENQDSREKEGRAPFWEDRTHDLTCKFGKCQDVIINPIYPP